MNQIVGGFVGKVGRELQNQPKMLALNRQAMLSVDTNPDNPEIRRVTFFTASNSIFYLALALDRMAFIRLHNEGVAQEAPDPCPDRPSEAGRRQVAPRRQRARRSAERPRPLTASRHEKRHPRVAFSWRHAGSEVVEQAGAEGRVRVSQASISTSAWV